MNKLLLTLVTVLTFTGTVMAEEPSFQGLLAEIDEQENFPGDLSAKVTLLNKKPGENDNISQFQYFLRGGDDQFLLLFLKPEVTKGQGYLKIGENVIFYDPESRKFSKLSRSGNVQDSDAKNSDFEASSFHEDYIISGPPARDKLGPLETFVLTLQAKRNDTTFPKKKIWVDTKERLLRKSEDYSLSDRLMRTSLYGKYLSIDGHRIATQRRYSDALRVGEVTDVILENVSIATLPDTVFTQAYLEKVNN